MRLFVAVRPPPEVLRAVADLDRPEQSGVRWARSEQWHVTIRFLGEVEDHAPVVAALDQTELPAAEATIGPTTIALGRGVLCLPVSGLDELAAAVLAATSAFGRPPDHPRFTGHLTLARVAQGGARRVAGAAFDARFAVHEIELLRSHLSRDGATHEVLQTFLTSTRSR
jgi:2'-5' RNA ligase